MIQKINEASCNNCGGKCPNQINCIYCPFDLDEVSFASLLKLYQEGRLALECIYDVEGAVQGILPRMPYENFPGVIYGGHKNAKCKFWKDNHCTLESRYLPKSMDNENYIIEAYVLWIPYMEDFLEEMAIHILAVERKDDEKYFDHLQCKICGGKCCKRNGCAFAPSDFKHISLSVLKRIMEKGFVTIVEVENAVTGLGRDVLALRVRNKDEPVVNLSGNHNEGCILLEDTGCPFNDEDRPHGGRVLVPEKLILGTCTRGYSSRQCAEAWLPYQEMLEELKNEFEGRDIKYTGIC